MFPVFTVPPVALIVIEPAALLILTFVPAVSVAGVGVAPVLPISNCPFVSDALHAGTPLEFVRNIALLAVERPVTVFAELAYNKVLTAYVSASVEVDATQSVPFERMNVPAAPGAIGN